MKLSNWSYSRYTTWKKCPALLKYQKELPMERVTTPAMDRGTDVHKMIENALIDGSPLTDEFAYYESYIEALRNHGAVPEMPIALNAAWEPVPWDADYWWRGVLDCVVNAPKEVIIIDWKTGNEYADHRDQREIYAAAYAAVDPEPAFIRVIHTYVDKKQNTSTLFHRDDIPDLRASWEERVGEMLNDDRFIPNPGYHCRFCQYSRSAGGPCRF